MDHTKLYKRECLICGAPLPKYRRKYCSDECAKRTPRMSSLSKSERRPHEIICQDCGKPALVFTSAKRCPECQRNYRRKQNGQARKVGSEAICKKCGRSYTVNSGHQLYCKNCMAEARSAQAREVNLVYSREYRAKHGAKVRENKLRVQAPITCAICGKEFMSRSGALTCSEECKKERQRLIDMGRRKRR